MSVDLYKARVSHFKLIASLKADDRLQVRGGIAFVEYMFDLWRSDLLRSAELLWKHKLK